MPPDADARLHVTGVLDVTITRPGAVGAAIPGVPTLQVTGRVTDAATARPLPGLTVVGEARPLAEAAAPTRNTARWPRLATATTGADGTFALVPGNDAATVALFEQLLERGGEVRFRVEDGGRKLLQTDPRPLALNGLHVELPIAVAREPLGPERWTKVGPAIAEARIGRVNDLVATLAANTGDGPFAAWSPAERLAGLAELEAAFLDPAGVLRRLGPPLPTLAGLQAPGALEAYVRSLDPAALEGETRDALLDLAGKAAAFQRLDDVDWVMEPTALQRGNLGAALTHFQDDYRVKPDKFGDHLFPRIETDLTRYRDYLREIWITIAQLYEPVQNQKLTPQQAAQQLATRFHQNFYQTFVADQPANEVAISIVKSILTAPTGDRWGLGLQDAAIPARGTLTAREYLDKLIALTGVSAAELGLRYRIDLQRLDAARSSPVQENIATLQAFFRDSFQAVPDPVGAHPNIHEQPIVPPLLQGKAPFFLWFDEWLRQQQPFFAENHFDFRRALPVRLSAENRAKVPGWLASTNKPAEKADWQLIEDVCAANDLLVEANALYYNREYALAAPKYEQAWTRLLYAMTSTPGRAFDIKGTLAARKQVKVTRMAELDAPPKAYSGTFADPVEWQVGGIDWQYRESTRNRMAFRSYYWLLYVLPMVQGDVALAAGDYERAVFHYGRATRFPIGVAHESDAGGYRPHYLKDAALYHIGSRPYTANTRTDTTKEYPLAGDSGEYYDTTVYNALEQLAAEIMPEYAHPIERKACRLRQGNALLEWADALYRTDEPSSVERARELYKAVLYLHGAEWPISPTWPQRGSFGVLLGGLFQGPLPSQFYMATENPAVASQKARARAGVYKISNGLNWYGEADDVVPVLRYRALKEVADRFAALAKATQQDFLLYTEKMEAAMADRMRLANLIQKGGIQIKVADEQTKIAQHGVSVAKAQVDVIREQIKAKRKELEDSQDFFSQLGDFFSGMVKTFTGMPGGATGFIGEGFSATAAGTGGLAAGMGVLGGYAAFVYAGYTSLSAMAEEYSSLSGQIKALEQKAMPAAEAQVRAREREVQITLYQRQLAEADLKLARDLLTFEERRFLGLEFWSELARLMVRLLHRYLVLAARTAWLAERALAYELDRDIRIVRFDYFPERLQGVTGPDLMLADLAELEAVRVEGTARSMPVRVTTSLAAEHPLAFGKLKQSGACSFATTEAWLRALYPGTSGYRIRAVAGTVVQTGTLAPIRGVLVNEGVSVLRPDASDARGLVRPAEGLPMSEFRLDRDLAVHGLPNEALFPFEGSGIETFWRIELPLAGNAASLSSVADVLITFDLRAQYDPALHAAQAAQPAGPVRRWILMSAQRFARPALEALIAGQAATLAFDFTALGLSAKESNRTVTNLGFALVATTPFDVNATASRAAPAGNADIVLKDGVAYSNVHPDPAAPPQPPMALNALTVASADQIFSLAIDPAQNPGWDYTALGDVLCAIEYSAQLV